MSLDSIVPDAIDLTYYLQGNSEEPSKTLAECLLQTLNARFSLFLQPTSAGFDPLSDAACTLDPKLATTLLPP